MTSWLTNLKNRQLIIISHDSHLVYIARAERCLFEEDIHVANKHMKRCSKSLVIREMQIKTCSKSLLEKCTSKLPWDITSHQSGWLSSKKPTNNKSRREYGEKVMIIWRELRFFYSNHAFYWRLKLVSQAHWNNWSPSKTI